MVRATPLPLRVLRPFVGGMLGFASARCSLLCVLVYATISLFRFNRDDCPLRCLLDEQKEGAMPLSWNEIRSRALAFSQEYHDATRENAESQSYYYDFFYVFGISRRRVASFEEPVN